MKYHINNQWLTPEELSEISGIKPHTIRDRLRRGYSIEEAIKVTPVHDSIKEFCEASLWEDWIGMSISDLYEIYWQWCIRNGYTAVQKQGFSRQLSTIYPMLKTIPTKRGDSCKRIIRTRS